YFPDACRGSRAENGTEISGILKVLKHDARPGRRGQRARLRSSHHGKYARRRNNGGELAKQRVREHEGLGHGALLEEGLDFRVVKPRAANDDRLWRPGMLE